MKNHFYFGYPGNKRDEFDTLEKYFIDKDIKIIIEPYVGTSAFSVNLALKYPGKFKYILNDSDENLIELYKTMKDRTKREQFTLNLNEAIDKITDKQTYSNIHEPFIKYFIHHKYNAIRVGLFPIKTPLPFKKHNYDDNITTKFLENENVELLNEDGQELINKYKNNKSVFMYIDPPYMNNDNTRYDYTSDIHKNNVNIYEWFYNNKMNKMKSKILINIEDVWISRLLFKNNIKHSYEKRYQTSKKKTKHLIITNYMPACSVPMAEV